jgi:CO dehydrogenase/acetyl-CoA synthase gamma subunit (corrinoid Fe-S protein)
MIVADFRKKEKKMLVGLHHQKFEIVVAAAFVAFLDHLMIFHVLKVYNIHPRRRRRSKLHTDIIKKENSKFLIQPTCSINRTK